MVISAIGKHVSWEKLNGKPNASMQERTGFGSLSLLEVDRRMVIVGDYGLSTTVVTMIDPQQNGSIIVKTLNSVYLLTVRD